MGHSIDQKMSKTLIIDMFSCMQMQLEHTRHPGVLARAKPALELFTSPKLNKQAHNVSNQDYPPLGEYSQLTN
jgi:hypothetical protein